MVSHARERTKLTAKENAPSLNRCGVRAFIHERRLAGTALEDVKAAVQHHA